MYFSVLGAVEATEAGKVVVIERPQRRALLSYLLVNANRVVSADQAVAALWGADAPASARTQVQAAVSGIRRHLRQAGDVDRLTTRSGGYLITVAEHELDLALFESQVAQAQQLAGQEAVATFRAALDLWRGAALTGVEAPFATATRVRLEEQRLTTYERLIDLELSLCRHDALISELSELVRQNPLREHLTERLMLALHRCGRQADALESARLLRRRLADELGLDPGRSLMDLEQAILRGDRGLDPVPAPQQTVRAVGPVPAQLPSDVPDFAGREAELAQLNTMHGPGMVTLIAGSGGMGKTTLAVHWGLRLKDRYPDGQLYIDLHGYSSTPSVRPAEALARFLRALGVDPARVPADPDEAATLYRSLLAGRRMLIVLDNAASADQVRPMLPADPGCGTVITSRDKLTGLLVRDGARRLELGTLNPDESIRLLTGAVGKSLTPDDRGALTELAQICGHLPLALRLATAQIADGSGITIAGYVTELRSGDLLSALQVDGDPAASLRPTFELSYRRLEDLERRLFSVLALVPGNDFTAEAAAALLGCAVTEAQPSLERLATAHLLLTPGPGRYAFHDLLRLYAQDQADRLTDPEQAHGARGRLYDHYLGSTYAAAQQLYPKSLRLPLPLTAPKSFSDNASAMSWLEAERGNLVTAITRAADVGLPHLAWQLADLLRNYLFQRRFPADWIIAAQAALAAAEQQDDLHGQASARLSLGMAYLSFNNLDGSVEQQNAALELAERAGWPQAVGLIVNMIGIPFLMLGRLRQAQEYFSTAVEMAPNSSLQPSALTNLALADGCLGKSEEAIQGLRRAMAQHDAIENRSGRASTLIKLGALYIDLGDCEAAAPLVEEGLAIVTETGVRHLEADAIYLQGRMEQAAGRHREAVELLERAGQLAQEIDLFYVISEVRIALSLSELALGHPESALAQANSALELTRKMGYKTLEGRAHAALTHVNLHFGRQLPARESAQRALAIQSDTEYHFGLQEARVALDAASSQ